MYATSHKKTSGPSVGVPDYYVMYTQRAKSVCKKCLQGYQFFLNDSVNLPETFMVREGISTSPQSVFTSFPRGGSRGGGVLGVRTPPLLGDPQTS